MPKMKQTRHQGVHYKVTFDRIGRSVGNSNWPRAEEFVAVDADELATVIYNFARQFMMSKDFEVTVNLADMRGSIGFGRFGSFTIEEVSPHGMD